jgi:hypothetical protein
MNLFEIAPRIGLGLIIVALLVMGAECALHIWEERYDPNKNCISVAALAYLVGAGLFGSTSVALIQRHVWHSAPTFVLWTLFVLGSLIASLVLFIISTILWLFIIKCCRTIADSWRAYSSR